MATDETCVWQGISGTPYVYTVHSLPVTFGPNQNGNYIYAKVENNIWIPVYIGEGDLGTHCGTTHPKAHQIAAKGATHFHEHLNPRASRRKAEEADILASYPMASEPNGCNEKVTRERAELRY